MNKIKSFIMRKCSIEYDCFWQIYKEQCIYLSKDNFKRFF